jgi:protochlorophyllide reductase
MSRPNPAHLLITGASSGIGLEAAKALAYEGHVLTLPCRTQIRCDQTRTALLQSGVDPKQLDCPVVDLADLNSVELSCQSWLAESKPLDGLILNAGLQRAGTKQPCFSPQGIELTFAVNHLAHQLMAMRLMPLLQANNHSRIVITASDVHNPASGGGRVGNPAGLGDMEGLSKGAGFKMVDGDSRFDADKAYKDSKLCNVLMGRELARQLHGCDRAVPVIAWSPGLVIPKSSEGFFRTSRQENPIGLALFSFVARDLLRLTESTSTAGRLLSALATEQTFAQPGFAYFSNHLIGPGRHRFEPKDTSEEAIDAAKAERLWQLSDDLMTQTCQV